ncbi:MAG: putative rane-associated phospholipid phosphatase [Bacteroidetes bacterium]|nr:putative rane-associated phospholipid phosphatase [Bacteroidota bacterium]
MDIISTIKDFDTRLFLFLNSKHNSFFDPIMFWASHRYFWIPLYLFFFALAWRHYGKKVWLVALAAVLLIVLSDQISVHVFKNVFLRYRPCHNLIIQHQVHLNDGRGGMYGFISSHAANTFALAMFLSLLFRNKIKYFGLFVFTWATFVAYSRIYNGVHYPADVLVGAIVGMGIGVIVYKLFVLAESKIKTE